MKRLSYWATMHVGAARWAIFGCYAVANILGYLAGFMLNAEGLVSGPALLFTFSIIAAAMLLHPKKGRAKAAGYSYAWHKACDAIICLATVALLAFCFSSTLKTSEPSVASRRWHKAPGKAGEAISGGAEALKQGRGYTFLQKARSWYRDLSEAERGLLSALVILATVAFCVLWAALCCSIACNGMSFLAVFLAIVGIGGAIVGCVYLCRRIIRGPKQARAARE